MCRQRRKSLVKESSDNINSNNIIFSNAPSDDENILKQYKYIVDGLGETLKNKKNKTIGIIGDFGSGKSTALEAFKKNNDKLDKDNSNKRRIANISLADFCSNKDVNDKDLQFSIVQQLFTGVKRYKIPASPFVKKGFTPFKIVFFLSSIIFLISLTLALLFHYEIFENDNWFNSMTVIASFSGITSLFFLFSMIPFKSIKAKISNYEFELQKLESDNVFDYFLEELIYFFRKTKIDLVIFEDIDRSPDCEKLFTKLYTLNICLNNSPYIKNKDHSIVFLHAVRETIFPDGEEKSKYFDVLLPVMPVLSTSNSADVFNEKLDALNYKNYFDPDFLGILSTKISYFRQMNNLINAFNLIYKTYKERSLSSTKDTKRNGEALTLNDRTYLLAGLLYKSMFPHDFIYALKGKGVLRYLFVYKEKGKFEEYIDNITYCPNEHYQISEAKDILTGEPVEEIKRKHYQDDLYKKVNFNFEQIKSLYESIGKWLNEESIMLISSMHETELSLFDSTYFTNLINDRKSSFIDEHFEEPLKIINNEEYLKHIGNDAACNIELFNTMVNAKTKNSAYKFFCLEYKVQTTIKDKFIISLFINKNVNKRDLAIFYQDISKNYDILNEKIIKQIDADNLEKYLDFIYSEVATTEEYYNNNNKDDFLTKYLSTLNDINKISLLSDEVFNKCFIEKAIKFKNISYSGTPNNIVIERFNKLYEANLFEINNDNVSFIYYYLNKDKKSNNFLTVFKDHIQTLSYILDSFKDGSRDFSKLSNDFSGEDPEFLFSLLAKSSFDFLSLPNFFDTCPPLKIQQGISVDSRYINEMVAKKKICGTFDELGAFREMYKTLSWITMISADPLLLCNGVPQTKPGINYLCETLMHEKLPTEELINKIYDNDIENLTIKFDDLPINCISYVVALKRGFVSVNNSTLAKIGESQDLLNCFYSSENFGKILDNIDSLSFSTTQLKNLLLKLDNSKDIARVINSKSSLIVSSFDTFKDIVKECDLLEICSPVLEKYLSVLEFTLDNFSDIFKIFSKIGSTKASNYLLEKINATSTKKLEFEQTPISKKIYEFGYEGLRRNKSVKRNVFIIRKKV